MRIAFFGTPETAVPSIEALLEAGHEISTVVTRPDRPSGRSGAPRATPVKRLAIERGIPVLAPVRLRSERFRAAIAAAEPELLVVVAYGRILPRSVFGAPRLGAINVHFSLLPRYRGAAPVQWALACGETVTGVTTMQLNERLDEGDILLQRELPIEAREHAPSLERRLAPAGAALLTETLERLAAGALEPRAQDHESASFAPLLSRADGEGVVERPAREVEGRIRGFDPWPGVWVRKDGRRIRLVEGEALPGAETGQPPGRIVAFEAGALVLACGRGSRLALRAVQPEGRRVLTARDAVNGRLLAPGDRLEPPPSR